MPLPPQLMAKAHHMARQRFSRDVIAKLRAKRLASSLPAQQQKEPDEDDLGGYDVLEQMFHAGGNDKGR
jgi:hypothetical protein